MRICGRPESPDDCARIACADELLYSHPPADGGTDLGLAFLADPSSRETSSR